MCLALALACNKEIIPNAPIEVTEGEEVTLSMSVSVPGMEVATRALGEYGYTDGAHPSLWVVVFDQQGYLVETAKAYDPEYTDISEDHKTTTQFSVDLHATPEPCIIHYLLNYSGDNLDLSYGHETSVIGALTVENKDVYWQRKLLPGGINDNVDYVATNFTQIPLVRNFAKITVTESADNFTLTGFYVLNVPKSGTVAPLSNGAFVNYQPTVPTGQTLYGVLTSGGYLGNMPDGVEFSNTAAPAADAFKTDAVYLYENTYSQNATLVPTILIKGRFGTDTDDTYYKADLLTNNLATGLQDYAHILRNFHYVLNIKSVVASGKSDPQGAIAAAANNNLSGSVEIKDLTNVTNGQAGIYVSFTDTTLVSSNPIVLKYKFVPDITTPAETNNGRVTVVAPAGNVLASEAVTGSDITSGSWNGWRTLTIRPKELPNSTQEQTIVLYDQATLLRREVLIRLRPKLTMEVQCVPESVASVPGTPVVVNIKIPQGLNKALFPLEFAIEANTTAANNTSLKQYISPAKSENTSVRTGETIVTETNTNGTLKYAGAKSYQYIKTLSYEDYEKLSVSGTQVVLPVYFVTNTAASASTVYVSNMYFNDANGTFGNFNATYNFAELEFGGRVLPGVGNDVTFTFNMDTDAPTNQVTVTLVGLKPATGSALTQVEGTSNQYSFTPSATSTNPAVTLNLVTTQEYGNVSVMLAANSYVGAVATAPQDLYSFSDLAFSGNVPAKKDEGVTFTFNMDTAAPNVPVTVTLVGLEPATGSGLTHVEGTSNQYTFTPSEEDVTTDDPEVALSLITTQESGTVSVSLAAGQYNNASMSAVQANEITIEIASSESIQFDWNNNNDPNTLKSISIPDGGVVDYTDFDISSEWVQSGYGWTEEWSISFEGLVFVGEGINDDTIVTIVVGRGTSNNNNVTFTPTIGALKGN